MIALSAVPPAASASPNEVRYNPQVMVDPTGTAIHARQHAPAKGAIRRTDASNGVRSNITVHHRRVGRGS